MIRTVWQSLAMVKLIFYETVSVIQPLGACRCQRSLWCWPWRPTTASWCPHSAMASGIKWCRNYSTFLIFIFPHCAGWCRPVPRWRRFCSCPRGFTTSAPSPSLPVSVPCPKYWPLIGPDGSNYLNSGLLLVNMAHVTWILASDWMIMQVSVSYLLTSLWLSLVSGIHQGSLE